MYIYCAKCKVRYNECRPPYVPHKITCVIYRLPKGALTSNCETELQDLMHHIDDMMSSKKRDWEHQIQSLQDRMDIKDKESMLHRATIDQKHKEVRHIT